MDILSSLNIDIPSPRSLAQGHDTQPSTLASQVQYCTSSNRHNAQHATTGYLYKSRPPRRKQHLSNLATQQARRDIGNRHHTKHQIVVTLGLLHRGTESLVELRHLNQWIIAYYPLVQVAVAQ